MICVVVAVVAGICNVGCLMVVMIMLMLLLVSLLVVVVMIAVGANGEDL